MIADIDVNANKLNPIRPWFRAHFEANLIPLGDDTMKVAWFCDEKPLDASHRFRTVYAFGLVVLEILDVRKTDSKVYKCVATNAYGRDEVSCDLECVSAQDRVVKPKFTRHLKVCIIDYC